MWYINIKLPENRRSKYILFHRRVWVSVIICTIFYPARTFMEVFIVIDIVLDRGEKNEGKH